MDAWFELLPKLRELERLDDADAAKRIYSFARWCWEQPDHQNAVAVAFYEHLVDDEVTRRRIPERLTRPEVFRDLIPLFRQRLEQKQFRQLLEDYDSCHKTRFTSTS
ncbi:MAG: hypothetical protein Phyf2KO_21170 [Phycisphaerales bacterium]